MASPKIFDPNEVISTSGESEQYWTTKGPNGKTLRQEVTEAWETLVKDNPPPDALYKTMPDRYSALLLSAREARAWTKEIDANERIAFDKKIAELIRTSETPYDVSRLKLIRIEELLDSARTAVSRQSQTAPRDFEIAGGGHINLARGTALRNWDNLKVEFADTWLEAARDATGKTLPADEWIKDHLPVLYQAPEMTHVSKLREEFKYHPKHQKWLTVFDEYVADQILNTKKPQEIQRIGYDEKYSSKTSIENLVDILRQWQEKQNQKKVEFDTSALHPLVAEQVAHNAAQRNMDVDQAILAAAKIQESQNSTRVSSLELG